MKDISMDRDVRILLYVVVFAIGMLIAVYLQPSEPTQKDYAVLLLDTAFAEMGGRQ